MCGGAIEVNAKGLKAPMKAYDVRGIAGEWKLELPERVENFVDLKSPLIVRFAVMEEKHVGELKLEGAIRSLSLMGGVLQTSEKLAPLMNLKMRVIGTSGGEIPADLYAKVFAVDERGPVLAFTSIPPEVGNCIKGVLDQVPRPTAPSHSS